MNLLVVIQKDYILQNKLDEINKILMNQKNIISI